MGAASYGIATAVYLLLALLLVTSWRGRLQGGLLVVATVFTALWAALAAVFATRMDTPVLLLGVDIFELLRDVGWALFLLKLLNPEGRWDPRSRRWAAGLAVLAFITLVMVVYPWLGERTGVPVFHVEGRLFGHLLLAVVGLAIVEQLFRNTRPDKRWAIKYLCFGIGGLYAYDFFMYADALLFKRIDAGLWQARGLVNAVVMPLIALSAARNPDWSLDVFVSRRVVMHTVTLVGAGIYLLVMAVGGWYIREFGGDWGHVAQAVFLFGALMVLVMLMFSGAAQARLKVFLNKHFFNYKYDYREEWLRFIKTLSEADPRDIGPQTIIALADIVDSPGGGLWWLRDGQFHYVACANASEYAGQSEPEDGSLARFLAHKQWVIRLDEIELSPEAYAGLVVPSWLAAWTRAWLVVPLMQHERLVGFVVLLAPRAPRSFNWEDSDLLKTAGRQAASYLAQTEAAEALAEARQFEAFSRMSAFLMHDLKNVVAQLSLVVSNAAKHKHNPAFVDDAFATVDNASQKMSRLLAQLRGGAVSGAVEELELGALLKEVVTARAADAPAPVLKCAGGALSIRAGRDRLADVLGHVVQNAQDATAADGSVTVRLAAEGAMARIEVEDTGSGMDADFVRERLFKPFVSTKGRGGMGIGAYEARELVQQLGGRVEVDSAPGRGTCFRIYLPLAGAAPAAAANQ
ncbi:MAG TPA: PEP-CTERM system histidine kinase PrsK [Gammaproteobacteria bacterium]|nr:PEP-CTERM system histidine kinase PrsK [Gammaproteobacteria bacterium]